MENLFLEVEPGVYIATHKLQDILKDEKQRLNLTWKVFSERIGNISPEFLGSIARGTSSNRFSEETRKNLVNYITSLYEGKDDIPDLATVPTDVLIAEIKKRLEPKNNIQLPHKCPCCGVSASSFEQVDDIFGVRSVHGRIVSQSWCRNCRKNSRYER